MRTLKQLVNRPEEFKEYLEQQPEGAEVGVACHTGNCPVARYVKAKKPRSAQYVTVYEDVTYLTWERHEANPKWLQTFIHQVDHNKRYDMPVTREEALKVLEEATNERAA